MKAKYIGKDIKGFVGDDTYNILTPGKVYNVNIIVYPHGANVILSKTHQIAYDTEYALCKDWETGEENYDG